MICDIVVSVFVCLSVLTIDGVCLSVVTVIYKCYCAHNQRHLLVWPHPPQISFFGGKQDNICMQEKLIHCIHTMVCTHVLHTPHHLPLDQVPGLFSCEVKDVQTVHIAGVESDRVTGLNLHIFVGQEVIRKLWGACHLTGSL